jgi:hypothetical protein
LTADRQISRIARRLEPPPDGETPKCPLSFSLRL